MGKLYSCETKTFFIKSYSYTFSTISLSFSGSRIIYTTITTHMHVIRACVYPLCIRGFRAYGKIANIFALLSGEIFNQFNKSFMLRDALF